MTYAVGVEGLSPDGAEHIIQMIHYEGYLAREAYEMHTEAFKIAEWAITGKPNLV